MVSILVGLGMFFRKLSIEPTVSFSKKNCEVMSFPLLLNHTRIQPFSIRNIFCETSPSFKSVVLAGTSKDRKSTRLNSSHVKISYAVFCLKKKKKKNRDVKRKYIKLVR